MIIKVLSGDAVKWVEGARYRGDRCEAVYFTNNESEAHDMDERRARLVRKFLKTIRFVEVV